jgi:hypothetical protein
MLVREMVAGNYHKHCMVYTFELTVWTEENVTYKTLEVFVCYIIHVRSIINPE